MKKLIISSTIFLLTIGAALVYFFVLRKDVQNKIIIPYISHQKPRIDPHLPSSIPIADKLDEVLFEGLFNVSANPSGITYEDGLGEFLGIDKSFVVSVRLKPSRKWHSSYSVVLKKNKAIITDREAMLFSANDVRFTLRRIQSLGSLSPDYILVSQALKSFDFVGPDESGVISFTFRTDRMWTDNDIKEVLSFKVLPANSEINAPFYINGTGPYLYAGMNEQDVLYFYKNPSLPVSITNFILKPFIDNSTYITELKNHSINVLLATPFGAMSSILGDSANYFYKSNISTVFFSLFFNTQRLNLTARKALRQLIDNKKVMDRFFKLNTPQQRHITDYKGNYDNYADYLNYSIFPSSTYYVEEKIVTPLHDTAAADYSSLPDTVRIQTCLNYDYREELAELVTILNDPALFGGKVKVTAVQNEELKSGNYDAVLVPITNYRSNFLFDLYEIFLREPDFALYTINLHTGVNEKGERIIDNSSFTANKNFFRLDLTQNNDDTPNVKKLSEYIFGFMSTSEIGDKQAYAEMIDRVDQETAFGDWLFSLPSLAYFSTQFEAKSIDLYGIASQLSTVEKWQERPKK
ncbi:MAG: hypothetical protein JW795_18435 [Chitinivibrionales bacterium]|nr:hypothetical protein [Chitinivibrionales bacterium]